MMKRWNAVWVFSLLAVALVAPAVTRAEPVPQEIGFEDVTFQSLSRSTCEGCHGATLADLHHRSEPASQGRCAACHVVSTQAGRVGVALERRCAGCHERSPHHQTQAAKDRNCVACHSSPGVSAFGADTPAYAASPLVTPTRDRCVRCHSGGTVGGRAIVPPKETHHAIAAAGCEACHLEDRASTSIRVCERCHSVQALHQVVPHIQENACVKCHGAG